MLILGISGESGSLLRGLIISIETPRGREMLSPTLPELTFWMQQVPALCPTEGQLRCG